MSAFRLGRVDDARASMERLARRRGAEVTTEPIKGTRPRGATAAEDEDLARDLAADHNGAACTGHYINDHRSGTTAVCAGA